MKTIDYQISAVKELKEKTRKLLSTGRRRRSIIFKAPTGAGKTVMASMYLGEITEELEDDGGAAFIWIAPNKLHEQSYFKIKTFFDETRTVRPATFDDLSDNSIKPGDVLFLNWESINKDNAVIIRDNEIDRTLYQCVRNTRRDYGCPIIVIIDEEHMFAGKNAKKAQKVLDNIDADIELRISATPISQGDEMVNVLRSDVVAAQMIKKSVVLNEGVEQQYETQITSSQYLTKLALQKCDEISAAYQSEGVKINPLLLIQMPNDSSDKIDADDQTIMDEIVTWLDVAMGINTKNGSLAVWLSGRKDNLEGIEDFQSNVRALIFKQAIALGWDCPRAGVLLIFRKTESYTFTTQTVGRILRMPQQRFYNNEILNVGHVFTDINKDKIQIIADDMDYISTFLAKRREPFSNIALSSNYVIRKSEERNRLDSKFWRYLAARIEKDWLCKDIQLDCFKPEDLPNKDGSYYDGNRQVASANQNINFDVRQIMVRLADETKLNTEGETNLTYKIEYAKTSSERNRLFAEYLAGFQGQFEKENFVTRLNNAVMRVMEEYFGYAAEFEVYPIILAQTGNNPQNANNRPRFNKLIQDALDDFMKELEKRRKTREIGKKSWEVPPERVYFEDTNEKIPEVQNHALMDFFRQKNASTPEVEFEQFLEQNTQYIDWWYKNGDHGSEHFAVEYGNGRLFYPDFIIRMKSGKHYILDTKREPKLFPETVEKHNALFGYLETLNADINPPKYYGGIIMRDPHGNWLYPPGRITEIDENQFAGWTAFFPDQA